MSFRIAVVLVVLGAVMADDDSTCGGHLLPYTCRSHGCVWGAVVPACQECFKDSDCANETQPFCHLRQQPPVILPIGLTVNRCSPCMADKDCKDPKNPFCDTGPDRARCGECLVDGDCEDSVHPKCRGAKCVGTCSSTNYQCSGNAPLRMDSFVCPPGGCDDAHCCKQCNADSDCVALSSSKPYCRLSACNSLTTCWMCQECLKDADCTDPKKPICKTGTDMDHFYCTSSSAIVVSV